MSTITTDICVIGGGSGGLSVAAGAVQMGARVVLIEGHKMGGDCLNYGCVPSKALLAQARDVKARGTKPSAVDFTAAMDHVKATIATIEPHDSVERFEGLGVQVLQGYGRFTGPDRVEVNGTTVKARRFVISTGSTAFVPPIDGIDTVPYMTNETVFDQKACPRPFAGHRRRPYRVGIGAGASTAGGRGDGDRGRKGHGPRRPGRRSRGAGQLAGRRD